MKSVEKQNKKHTSRFLAPPLLHHALSIDAILNSVTNNEENNGYFLVSSGWCARWVLTGLGPGPMADFTDN